MKSWQEKKAMRTVSLEPAGRAVRKRPTGDSAAAVRKRYEVARDPGFAKIVASGTAAADAAADFTVHQRVSGAFLAPGEEYF